MPVPPAPRTSTGGPRRVRRVNRTRPGCRVLGAGGGAVPPRASARRSATKSRLGGGEEARRPRSLPTLSTLSTSPAPHVKRNNLFILAFKNPALLPVLRGRPVPPPFLPSLPPRRDPAQSRRQHLPPPLPPPLPDRPPAARSPPPSGTRPWGREPANSALSAWRPRSVPEAAGGEGRSAPAPCPRPVAAPTRSRLRPPPPPPPLPRSQPRARRRGGLGVEEERVSESQGGRCSRYKQEA